MAPEVAAAEARGGEMEVLGGEATAARGANETAVLGEKALLVPNLN